MSIFSDPATLSRALGKASKKITAIYFEYPAFWSIQTKANTYSLGDVNEFISWHTEEGDKAGELPNSDQFTAPEVIALAFAKWLETVEGN